MPPSASSSVKLLVGHAATAAAGANSALVAARTLERPKVSLIEGGEFEGHEFWEKHHDLLTGAWQELGPCHRQLYVYGPAFQDRYIQSALRKAVTDARADQDEVAAKALFDEVVPGVFASQRLFTEKFTADMLSELEHISQSGIPQRRPNGMNRYGVILDDVGLEKAINGIVTDYIRPLAGMLFPELVGAQDAEQHYAFSVRYEVTGDTALAKHGDASVVTMNLCLGQPGWRGGDLRFFEYEPSGIYALPHGSAGGGAGNVTFQPGMVLLHRGQHKHQALPLLGGQRSNIVVWLYARDGSVRVSPYKKADQQTPQQRWQNRSTESNMELQLPSYDSAEETDNDHDDLLDDDVSGGNGHGYDEP